MGTGGADVMPDFESNALIPAVVQDATGGDVRMIGYMNREAFDRTLSTGELHLYSRSRGRLWKKGETSGNVHRVVAVRADCDGDALLVLAEPKGPTCHTGAPSCFSTLSWGCGEAGAGVLPRLEQVINARLRSGSDGSYTVRLARRGTGRIAQKVGEEALESVLAAMEGGWAELVGESADLLYHLMVLWADRGVRLGDVLIELARLMERKP
jgi:phosphoribosyl-ATP pyrophosphohydrolase/phosphoribosyl-AMP cyclohydrolase